MSFEERFLFKMKNKKKTKVSLSQKQSNKTMILMKTRNIRKTNLNNTSNLKMIFLMKISESMNTIILKRNADIYLTPISGTINYQRLVCLTLISNLSIRFNDQWVITKRYQRALNEFLPISSLLKPKKSNKQSNFKRGNDFKAPFLRGLLFLLELQILKYRKKN